MDENLCELSGLEWNGTPFHSVFCVLANQIVSTKKVASEEKKRKKVEFVKF